MEQLLESDNANGNCEVAFNELWTGNTNTSTSPCLLNSANEELLDNSKPVTSENTVHQHCNPQDDINKNCTELNNFRLGSTSRNQGFVSLDQRRPVAAKRASKEHTQLIATGCGDVMANSNIFGSSQSPAPPLLSDHDATGLMTNQINKKSGGNFDEIEMLWLKVESLMTAKQGKVQQVLGGYGEAGGGDNKDRETEEERVWQVLQRNLSVE